jgi:tripartite ATP-independent transporter DctP family solute receptor
MKRLISILLAGLLVLSITACGGNVNSETSVPAVSNENTSTQKSDELEGPKINLVWGHGAAEESTGGKAAIYFKELIEERTGGKITVDIYPAFQLGSIMELTENIQTGNIDMISGSPNSLLAPELSILDLPNAYSDWDKIITVFKEGEVRDLFEKAFNKTNSTLLSIIPGGYRQMSSNVEVRSVDDLKNINIRTMENPVHMGIWKAFGSNPTPVAWGETYIALQQGLVQAQENPYNTIVSSKMYEQQKYIIKTNHVMFWNAIWLNMDTYNSMPDSYKEILWEVVNEVEEYTLKITEEDETASIKYLEDAGLEIIELSDDDYSKMAELAQPVYEMIRSTAGDEIYNAVTKALELE